MSGNATRIDSGRRPGDKGRGWHAVSRRRSRATRSVGRCGEVGCLRAASLSPGARGLALTQCRRFRTPEGARACHLGTPRLRACEGKGRPPQGLGPHPEIPRGALRVQEESGRATNRRAGRRTKRMQGTPQAYLSFLVDVKFDSFAEYQEVVEGAPLMRMPFCATPRERRQATPIRVANRIALHDRTRSGSHGATRPCNYTAKARESTGKSPWANRA
jgi:hypothetical protein